MSLISILFLGFITLLLCYAVVLLSSSVMADYRQGLSFRQTLVARMHLLPISKLLKQTHIDIDEYVVNKPVHEIDSEIRNCEDCGQNEACVDALKTSNPDTETILKSCPNSESFSKYKNNI